MKTFTPVLLLLFAGFSLYGQFSGAPDTLLSINFSDPNDTLMLPASSGNDDTWVNWDGDKRLPICGESEDIPGGWYREGDLGEVSEPAVNYCYTSCSWFDPVGRNNNWLITPPITIADSSYRLSWKSLSFQGPQFLDGYKVLVSESLNLPEKIYFNDTIFIAAEMLGATAPYSLNLDDYQFSEGYIHANGYQDLKYFFLDLNLGPDGLFHGILEPHTRSLEKYAGKTIYIAFVHDSENDFILQIDDIVVSNKTSSVSDIPGLTRFTLYPNPVRETAMVSWELSRNLPELRLQLRDCFGRLVRDIPAGDAVYTRYLLDMAALPAGVYYCTLWSKQGQTTRRVVKI